MVFTLMENKKYKHGKNYFWAVNRKNYNKKITNNMDSMTAWQYNIYYSMTVWQYDSMAVWQYGSMAVWQYDSMTV